MRARLLMALVTTALVAAGCGGGDTGDGGVAATTSDAPGVAQTTRPGTDGSHDGGGLLAFQAVAVDGATVDVGDLAGRDLAIWFWAPW